MSTSNATGNSEKFAGRRKSMFDDNMAVENPSIMAGRDLELREVRTPLISVRESERCLARQSSG